MFGRLAVAAVIGGGIGAGAVSAVKLTGTPSDAPAAFAQNWMDLHARCRTAIETAEAIDETGLTAVTTLKRDGIERDLPKDQTAWHGSDDRVVLIEFAPTSLSGNTRGCRVEMADDMYAPELRAANIVLRGFLEERSALVAEGSHMDADPLPITPGFGLGFQAIAPNADGCMTQSQAFFSEANGINLMASMETQDFPCRENSFNAQDWKARA